MENDMKKGVKIALIFTAVAAAGAAAFFGARHFLGGSSEAAGGEVAYVTSVAEYMGLGTTGGMVNRFAGVVESQETWSVNQNSEYEVKEVYVKVGDSVKEGDKLFTYDIEKFESELTQAEIDLERLNNELESMNTIRDKLEKEAQKASSSEKANYTIQIQEQELNIKQKEIDIQSKELDIAKLKENIEHATVVSGLTGVVKSVNSGGGSGYGDDENSAFITVMQVGDYRVKGTINEQNMYDINVGDPMIVYSRVDNKLKWYGTIARIDTENAEKDQNQYYYDSGSNSSSKYPFYVELDSSGGLILGQHVYMETDMGQGEEPDDRLMLSEYLIDFTDEAHPFVWKDENGKLIKQEITLGEYNEDLMEYEVTGGLAAEDRIAFPEESLTEGMPTADMADMSLDEAEEGEMDMEDFDMGDGMDGDYGEDLMLEEDVAG